VITVYLPTGSAPAVHWLMACVLAVLGLFVSPPTARAQSAPTPGAPTAPEASSPEASSPEAGSPDAGSPEAGSPEAALPEPALQPADLTDEADPALPHETASELDEVVVTVDRRSKSLQEYSGTAAAFSEHELSRIGISNLRDLASQVPGLQMGNQEGNTEIYIRGVGSDNNTELGDPAVALHLDGVYLPRPRGLGAMFFDIERVEVNSGPQGTLRGRNALGGSINIVSNPPRLAQYEANAEATVGTFATRRYQGMLNVPIGDKLAARVAAFSEVHDPYWENAGPVYDLRGAESSDSYALRAQIKWQPSSAFSALVGYDFTRERGTGWLGANFQGPLTRLSDNGTPGDPSDDTPDPLAPDEIENPRRIYQRGMQSGVDLKHHGVRAQLNYDAGPVQLEALLSYRDLRYQQINGSNAGVVYPGYTGDASTPDNFGSAYWDQASQSFVGELRVFAPDTARFRWTAGAFFFKEDQQTFLGQTTDQAVGFGGGEFPMPSTVGGSSAGFADGTFDVTESLRILGGLRITHEDKSRNGGLWASWSGFPGDAVTPVRFGTEGFRYKGLGEPIHALPDNATVADRVNLFLDGIESFGARDSVPQYLCADPPAAMAGETQEPRLEKVDGHFRCKSGINPSLLAQDAAYLADPSQPQPFAIQAVAQNNEVDDVFVDWRVGAELDLAKDSLLYATVSTGHKSGGFNDTALNDGLFNSEYGPEDVIAFEVGSKNLLLERRFRLNASAFIYRYRGQVFQTIVAVTPPDPDGMGGSNTAVRQNAATSNVVGLDIDAVYSLPAGLELGLHALLMDARFGDGVVVNDSRIGFDVAEYPVDIGGNWLPRVSPLTLNYSVSQLIFSTVGSFDWVLSGQTRSTQYQTVFNGKGELLPATDGRVPTNPDGSVVGSYAALQANPARLTDVVPTYSYFNFGVGWRHPDGRLSISGFVNNIANVAFATSIIATPGLNLRFFNPPRTAGLRVRVEW
jgi:iron complex outermembrane recepter protein